MKFLKVLMISAAFAAALAKNCVRPPKPCYIGGCSSQVCSAEEGVITTCLWEPSFACYQDATCERQSNGECGWTQTAALEQCIENAGPGLIPVPDPCFVGGCSNEVCSDEEGVVSTCIWSPVNACYSDATCERQSNGQCGWTQTDSLQECIDNAAEEEETSAEEETAPGVEAPCFVGGCSNEVCSDEEGVVSTCIWSPVNACYSDATCERQDNGQCGWTQTKALKKCIDNAASENAADPVV